MHSFLLSGKHSKNSLSANATQEKRQTEGEPDENNKGTDRNRRYGPEGQDTGTTEGSDSILSRSEDVSRRKAEAEAERYGDLIISAKTGRFTVINQAEPE